MLTVCEGVERGDWAIVAAVEGSALVELQSFARAFRVPLIAFGAARETENGDGDATTSIGSQSVPSTVSDSGFTSGPSNAKPEATSQEDVGDGLQFEWAEDADGQRDAKGRTATAESTFMLNVKPPTSLALAHLIRHYNWSNLTFIYDSVQGVYFLCLFYVFVY